MSKLTLNKEQMDKLKELGVDTSKAKFKDGFTLQEIIDLLPEYPYSDERDPFSRLYISKCEVSYLDLDNYKCYLSIENDELIDAAYDMLVHSIGVGFNKIVMR